MRKYLRPTGKITDIIPLAVIFTLLLELAGVIFGMIYLGLSGQFDLVDKITNGNANLTEFMNNYLVCIGVWIAFFLFVLIPKKDRRMIRMLGYREKGNTVKGLLIGLLLGFGTNAVCVGFSLLFGDIKLSFYGFEPVTLLSFFLAVFIQSGSEELVVRLYLYQRLRRRYRNPLVAILVNSILFMVLHMANPGFNFFAGVQIFLVAVLLSMFVYYYGSFWATVTFHTAWNFTQNLLFGLPNSGVVSAYSLFKLEAASARDGFFYNVGFGIEGSIGSCLILLLLIVIIFLKNKGKEENWDLWQEPMAATQNSPV